MNPLFGVVLEVSWFMVHLTPFPPGPTSAPPPHPTTPPAPSPGPSCPPPLVHLVYQTWSCPLLPTTCSDAGVGVMGDVMGW